MTPPLEITGWAQTASDLCPTDDLSCDHFNRNRFVFTAPLYKDVIATRLTKRQYANLIRRSYLLNVVIERMTY